MRILVITLWGAVACLGYLIAKTVLNQQSLDVQIAAKKADVSLKLNQHRETKQHLRQIADERRAREVAKVVESKEAILFKKAWSDPAYVANRLLMTEGQVYRDYEAFLAHLPLSAASKMGLATLLTERISLAQYQESHTRLTGRPSEEHAIRLTQVEARIAEMLKSVGAPPLSAYEETIPVRKKVAFFEQHLRNCDIPLTLQQVEMLVAQWHNSPPRTGDFSMPEELFKKLIEDEALTAAQINELAAMQQLRLALRDMVRLGTKQ